MYVLVTCKNEEDQMKNEGASVDSTLYSYIFYAKGQVTVAGGQLWPKSIFIQAFMVVLITCNNEDDPLKMKGLE